MRPRHVALIGVGQLGSRHLQALANLEGDVRLSIVDPNSASLDTARARFLQVQGKVPLDHLTAYSSLADLPTDIDVAILACNADVRRALVESLLSEKQVHNLILEKVLFQKLDDLDAVGDLLAARRIPTWVNCPFRMVEFYGELRTMLFGADRLTLSVTGASIGLGCNTIHYLDLLAFLAGRTDFRLDPAALDPLILESKRPGFKEFTGTLTGRSGRGDAFSITSFPGGNAPVVLSLASETHLVTMVENAAVYTISDAGTGWARRDGTYWIPYQSQLTHLVVDDLLKNGVCSLTPFTASLELHRALLQALVQHVSTVTSKECDLCPIT